MNDFAPSSRRPREDKRYGLPRIAHLRAAPARVRFLSVEPLLEDIGKLDLHGIQWVIVGGESGHGARPMQAAWVESLRDQCERAGVAFFVKQWGGVQKKKAGRTLDGGTYDQLPTVATEPVPDEADRGRRLREAERLALTFQRRSLSPIRVVGT